jgi:drug/metabolite transporter (DMT)-like permease
MTKRFKSNGILLLASLLWGLAFVAQRQGMQFVGPLTFNGLRFVFGALSLVPLLLFMKPTFKKSMLDKRLLIGSIMAGIALFFAASFQQVGIIYTSAGNAGFITSLYIIFVPLFGFLRRQYSPGRVWAGALVALSGLYMLSVGDDFVMQTGDLLVFISAIFWAAHLVILSYLAAQHDFRLLAIFQYAFVAIMSLALAFIFETPSLPDIQLAAIPILYAGIVSVGIGFTLQIIGQKHARADHAALILSLEAVFAALGGWLILNEITDWRGVIGCGLMLTGVLLSQLKPRVIFRNKTKTG